MVGAAAHAHAENDAATSNLVIEFGEIELVIFCSALSLMNTRLSRSNRQPSNLVSRIRVTILWTTSASPECRVSQIPFHAAENDHRENCQSICTIRELFTRRPPWERTIPLRSIGRKMYCTPRGSGPRLAARSKHKDIAVARIYLTLRGKSARICDRLRRS
jgi:hypothetical protein